MNQDHPDHKTFKISYNTEKSPGKLVGLASEKKTPVKTGVKNSNRMKIRISKNW